MRNFIQILLTLGLFAFILNCTPKNIEKSNFTMNEITNDPYDSLWQQVRKFDKDRLPKSAQKIVEEIYAKASKDNNPAQVIKSLIYKSKYINELEEDGLVKAINQMRTEIEKSQSPTKQILTSVMAEMYAKFADNQRYKIRNRTKIADYEPEDVRTWTLEDFNSECQTLYLASVQHPELKEIDIKNFNAITSGHDDKFRPNLYDFLAHRAIDYFLNERNFVTEPAYKFYIDQPQAFGASKDFINFKFESKDSSSNKLQILHILQDLTRNHINDTDPSSLLDVELKRLDFAKNNAVNPDKESLYFEALNQLKSKYKGNPIVAEVYYRIALYYQNTANQFKAGKDDPHRYDHKKAIEIAKKAVEKYQQSYGGKLCARLVQQIERKSSTIHMEQVNPSKAAILAQINYKNTDKVWLRTILLTSKIEKQLQNLDYEDRPKYLFGLSSINQWMVDLPNQDDYRQHSTEIKIDHLPYGKYIILMSDNDDYNNTTASYVTTYVSDLAYFNIRENSGINKFVVMDRVTGAPKSNVKITFFQQIYRPLKRRYEFKKVGTTISDSNGFFNSKGEDGKSYKIKLSFEKDELFLENNFSNYRYEQHKYTNNTTHFFLDRAIYRPGQMVYFKGILISTETDKAPKIHPNTAVTITFRDANWQEVSKLNLVSNEYGSINGNFTAPSGGLLGQMSMQSSFGGTDKYFRIEEYKRPKFEVDFNPVKESFKLNDKVSVNGNAKAFAGNNIDGATVKYRVVRGVHYPYMPYWMYRWGGYDAGSEMEITNGTTTTDENGKFEISFDAIPDKSISKDKKPEFSYKIYVDVVDITGETHSTLTSVSVGYIALRASISTPNEIHADSLKAFEFSTKNLNGEFEKATGTFKVIALTVPSKIFIKRRWEKPDSPLMNKDDFERNFPYFAYQDEDEPQNWKHGMTLLDTSFDSEKSLESPLNRQIIPGKYLLILETKDKYGIPVKVEKIITVINFEQLANKEFVWSKMSKYSFQPNETANIWYGSALKRQFLLTVEKQGKVVQEMWMTTTGMKKLSFDVTEKDRGNFFVSISSVLDNRASVTNHTINVPYSNKELHFEYTTFRDKLLPGAKEEWSIKISGDKKDKVTAEMLAGMYDASLDEFVVNNWYFNLFNNLYQTRTTNPIGFSVLYGTNISNIEIPNIAVESRNYRYLNWFGMQFYPQYFGELRTKSRSVTAKKMKGHGRERIQVSNTSDYVVQFEEEAISPSVVADGMIEQKEITQKPKQAKDKDPKEKEKTDKPVKVRTNLKETVFFFPNLKTDAEGNVIIKFTMNEALTKWKFMGLAHTKDLKTGVTTNSVVTQKDLMIVPNPPRFFREGDQIEFTAKVSNLTEKVMNGTAKLELFDAVSMKPVDKLLGNAKGSLNFTAKTGQSAPLSWKLTIPKGKVMAITHRVTAVAGNHSDGEESSLPVLTNRMMVTETMPLPVRGKTKRTFDFTRLSGNHSTTLENHKYTLEFTSNPAWYAVQAMPYMMEYPHQCTEQIFNRFFANSLGSSLSKQHPKIQRVFEQWKNTDAMLSNLSKNQELKSALLEETPWVLDAQDEEIQKKNIGLLFDLNRMTHELDKAFKQMKERQLSNGGFSWFPGGRDSWYITQYLVEGFGHLKNLGAFDMNSSQSDVLQNAVRYIDNRIVEHYDELAKQVKKGHTKWEDDHLGYLAIHYLYARSFFKDIKLNTKTRKVAQYYLGQADTYWTNKSQYMQGMLALSLKRFDKGETPNKIVASLKETSLNSDEMGMYWKYAKGYWWYQLPIETHALMIEVFDEVAQDVQAVDDLKVWLLKNKQTNRWKTTKSTAAAVYVLLNSGDNWLLDDTPVNISLGNGSHDQEIKNSQANAEAGTGYFKVSWDKEKVTKDMAKITVDNPNNVITWGAVYWQYFEDLDKITFFEDTPLKLKKQVFKEVNSPTGPKLTEVKEGTKLAPGDKLKIRIELRVDRTMEYVHMKDMRASGFEPINVLSQYKWQDGLGYYESTGDVATNFFFDYLPKGTYVFEYPVRVIHFGDFSNGITTIQSMYAPEFSSHSEGVRVKVER